MNEIRTRVLVGPDHRITGTAPPDVPPGEHEAVITIATPPRPKKPFTLADFPIDHTSWDDSISLRREDMYGDDGR
jgi:hypothetical protein